ncbi:TPA: exodeoxyribonuclease III, partial [Legionella pneumophila subsp. pneumophila]|nr:exodeoxyribonuclease III [Legionella pneumophila subsp. pneumophila]
YQVITPGLTEYVADSRIFREARFSDHAPLMIEYKGDWCV